MNHIKTAVKEYEIDRLKLKVYTDRQSMGYSAGHHVAAKLKKLLEQQGQVRIIFAAAPSQNEFLYTLARIEGIDWSRITVFQMDEYIGLPSGNPQTFGHYLSEHLFHIVKPGTVYLINSGNHVDEECRRYGNLVTEQPIDLVCMGIGENGHIAFNDPPVADFNDPETMKVVELDETCRNQQVNDGCFSSIKDVPTHAWTLTIPALMSASSVSCVVPGKTKRNAVVNILNGDITTECPASILRKHSGSSMYTDLEAYGEDLG